jgi:hypothetical protein
MEDNPNGVAGYGGVQQGPGGTSAFGGWSWSITGDTEIAGKTGFTIGGGYSTGVKNPFKNGALSGNVGIQVGRFKIGIIVGPSSPGNDYGTRLNSPSGIDLAHPQFGKTLGGILIRGSINVGF